MTTFDVVYEVCFSPVSVPFKFNSGTCAVTWVADVQAWSQHAALQQLWKLASDNGCLVLTIHDTTQMVLIPKERVIAVSVLRYKECH